MNALALLSNDADSRRGRDRLELLTALIAAPNFDPLYRDDIIVLPGDHPIYGWQCRVDECVCVKRGGSQLCVAHFEQWEIADRAGTTMSRFLADAAPLTRSLGEDCGWCRICGDLPAVPTPRLFLCRRHDRAWNSYRRYRNRLRDNDCDFQDWLTRQERLPTYGVCRCAACVRPAESPLGLCGRHQARYLRGGTPGGARLPKSWHQKLEAVGLPVPVTFDDEGAFNKWCVNTGPVLRAGVIDLNGLSPLAKAEFKWGLFAHTQFRDHTVWDYSAVQRLANLFREHHYSSTEEVQPSRHPSLKDNRGRDSKVAMIYREMVASLRVVYYSPADTREAGFLETDHFGRRFPGCRSHFDLRTVPQRWLRELLWDHLTSILRSPKCPRTRSSFEQFRRACTEFGAYLELDAPAGGHDPTALAPEHADRFAADHRHRERHGMPSLVTTRHDGIPSMVTAGTRATTFSRLRSMMMAALESGRAQEIGLTRQFVVALPAPGRWHTRTRSPLSDEVAHALAEEENLAQLARDYDQCDRGVRDIWEVIVATGRRCREVIELRLDCAGHYGGLPMLWHDQTKVGNYNEGIRIPEPIFDRIAQRQTKTLLMFERRHGRAPTAAERPKMALFPSGIRNADCTRSVSYALFHNGFKAWVEGLDLPPTVPHQARHTLATNLLRAGAGLAHIRRYLGHVSTRMTEHYTKIAHSDLEDALQAVWVTGPGAQRPGELISGRDATPLNREQALALAVDLSRRSAPADGGFCTFQPVVDGAACPWNLDCHNCDKFVMSGADLLYWRRKQEQWHSLAERAPDDATADYLHKVFEPTARAISGLEKALSGLGLLDEALQLDLRRPQDYFHRIWSLAFPATDLEDVAAQGVQ